MAAPNFDQQVKALTSAIVQRGDDVADLVPKRAADAAEPLLIWLDHLYKSELTGSSDEFLDGARAAIVESVACISIGLVRPALFAMRCQIDIILSWAYFKDHPVERSRLDRDGQGFMLKSDIMTYLAENYEDFSGRYKALKAAQKHSGDSAYKLLSAHVHGQSNLVIPTYNDFASLVVSKPRVEEAISIQASVSEYVSDILLAMFAEKWAALPKQILSDSKGRLGEAGVPKVFS